MSFFMSLDVNPNLWTHCPGLLLAILSSFLSWTGPPQRCMDKSPALCWCLVSLRLAPYFAVCNIHLCQLWYDTHSHRKTQKRGQNAHVGRHTNVQGMWKHEQKGNIDLSVAEEPVLLMKYRDFHFLIEKSPFWTEIWSLERSKFHDGDST